MSVQVYMIHCLGFELTQCYSTLNHNVQHVSDDKH